MIFHFLMRIGKNNIDVYNNNYDYYNHYNNDYNNNYNGCLGSSTETSTISASSKKGDGIPKSRGKAPGFELGVEEGVFPHLRLGFPTVRDGQGCLKCSVKYSDSPEASLRTSTSPCALLSRVPV